MFHKEFYPTPDAVIDIMLDKIKDSARYYLDPSAGKGDVVDKIHQRNRWVKVSVDCIEINHDLASILSNKNCRVVGDDFLNYVGVCYYDAIVMNPPFSNGVDHLLKAWEFIYEGEIVCLLNANTCLLYTSPSPRDRG